MTAEKIRHLLSLISQAIEAEGSWGEKRQSILNECSDEDKTALAEFASWFYTPEGERG